MDAVLHTIGNFVFPLLAAVCFFIGAFVLTGDIITRMQQRDAKGWAIGVVLTLVIGTFLVGIYTMFNKIVFSVFG